ncbi:MAG: hypothetical protein JO325_03615 [Solirubrobacterales bacterium]|nr:hypothetical protein [Solirubrobacterales bacterium]
MGEPAEEWAERVRLMAPYQLNAEVVQQTRNPNSEFQALPPGFHDKTTTVGREVMKHTGMKDGLEVTNDVFQSSASIVSRRPRTTFTQSSRCSSRQLGRDRERGP